MKANEERSRNPTAKRLHTHLGSDKDVEDNTTKEEGWNQGPPFLFSFIPSKISFVFPFIFHHLLPYFFFSFSVAIPMFEALVPVVSLRNCSVKSFNYCFWSIYTIIWTIFICLGACFSAVVAVILFFLIICYSNCWQQCSPEAHRKVFFKENNNKKTLLNFQTLWGDASLITTIVKLGNLKIWWNGISFNRGGVGWVWGGTYVTFVTFLPSSLFTHCSGCVGK